MRLCQLKVTPHCSWMSVQASEEKPPKEINLFIFCFHIEGFWFFFCFLFGNLCTNSYLETNKSLYLAEFQNFSFSFRCHYQQFVSLFFVLSELYILIGNRNTDKSFHLTFFAALVVESFESSLWKCNNYKMSVGSKIRHK